VEIIAIGSRELMDGFALLGIRTYADADAAEIDELLADLARRRERALVYIQQDLIGEETPMVQRLRLEGGSILICEIPRLGATDEYRPQVEKLIGRVLGSSMLEPRLED
jgi:vacuolar-type H+-ATPase subunit F/Vma7